jgi:hypothetical protein
LLAGLNKGTLRRLQADLKEIQTFTPVETESERDGPNSTKEPTLDGSDSESPPGDIHNAIEHVTAI